MQGERIAAISSKHVFTEDTHMNNRFKTLLLSLVLILFAGCSKQAEVGPTTWIDIPPEDIALPLAPFAIMAHATSNNGVASIEFHVNGELKMSLAPRFDGDERLGWAEWEFSPLSPGTYRIDVSAVDASGSTGAPDTAIVTIATNVQSNAPATPIEIPGGDVEGEAPATPIEIPGGDVEPEESDEPVDPIVVANRNANCREGRLADNSWFLIALPDSSLNCWISSITVNTQGKVDEITIASAPPPPPPEEESPPADTEPPGIFGSAPSKTTMCASDTVNSNVVTGDDGGIKKIFANWTIKNSGGDVLESGYVEYGPITSMENAYTAVLGNFTYSGTLTINGTVEDNAGNKAYFTNTVTIDCS
jgi:hypothetical protein